MEENLKSIIDDMRNHQKTSDITMNKIMSLKDGECLAFQINKDLSNCLELITDQILSYENLFIAFNHTIVDEYKTFDINLFREKYTDLICKKRDLELNIIYISLGEYVNYLNNNFIYRYIINCQDDTCIIRILALKDGDVNESK